MIPRIKEKDILRLLGFFPAIGIVGPRQVGKTTLAKEIINKTEKESIYLDLENPRDLAKLDDPVLYFEDNQHKCIILDEIQTMPELFPVLRAIIDENRIPGRFIILGSANPDLMRDSSESLAGRIAYIELATFNLLEIPEKSLDRLWLQGGFPDAYLTTDSEIVSIWHLNYIKTYIERDLPSLGVAVDKQILIKLIQMLSHMHGQILNYNNLSKSLGISANTVKRYINYFEAAFLVRLLTPYSSNLKKRLIKAPKVYIRDSGILHYLQNINAKEELYGNPIIGNSWEGFVIEQIIQQLPDKYDYSYYRTHDGSECDLVITKSQKPLIAIEIKYTAAPKSSRGTTIAFNDLRAAYNFIITPNSDDYLLKGGIRVCRIDDFLRNYLTLLK